MLRSVAIKWSVSDTPRPAVGAWVAQSVEGSNAARSKKFFFSQKHPDRPWAHPDSYGMGTVGGSTGVMRPVREADNSPAPSNEDKMGEA